MFSITDVLASLTLRIRQIVSLLIDWQHVKCVLNTIISLAMFELDRFITFVSKRKRSKVNKAKGGTIFRCTRPRITQQPVRQTVEVEACK